MPYTPPEYITLDDLKMRFTRVVEYLNDAGSVKDADPDITETIIRDASSFADSFLLGAFPKVTISELAEDYRFKAAVCDIAIGLAMDRRGEFLDKGVSPGAERYKRGKEALKMLGLGYERMGKESETKQNEALVYPLAESAPAQGWDGWI
jgi:hypothetical protein